MTGGGPCDLGRLTRPSTIASARTEIGEKMQIALTERSHAKRSPQFSNRYPDGKCASCSALSPNAVSQKTFVADDSHFFQRAANTAWQKINVHASKCRRIFPTKEKRRDR